jgi:hypothetical protein
MRNIDDFWAAPERPMGCYCDVAMVPAKRKPRKLRARHHTKEFTTPIKVKKEFRGSFRELELLLFVMNNGSGDNYSRCR